MQRRTRLVLAATFAAALFAAGASAAPANRSAAVTAAAEVSAQAEPMRQRPQIRVRPRYPYATTHSLYPRPYRFHYPGPNAKRYCDGALVIEHRPSGTVVVPRRHCWWGPG